MLLTLRKIIFIVMHFCHPFHQSQTEKNLQLIKYENILVLKIIQAHAFVT